MSRISEITAWLNKLPKGYISIKTINNKEYYYLQNKKDGKVVSKYIPNDQIENLKQELMYRSDLEEELYNLLNTGNNLATITNRYKQLTGYLMMEDKVVATFNNGILENIDNKLAPLFILRTHNLEEYLKIRSIDNTRTNSRLLKKVLGIHTDNQSVTSLHAYGATITDNYWFKAKGSKLKYKDICFDNDFYSDLALKGEAIVFPNKPKLTPEITTSGSYEKCWKYINNKWWLYKVGNEKEIFSELFVSKLANKLNINTATYYLEDKHIKTQNFSNKYNFEPMISIAGSDDNYENVFEKLKELNKDFLYDYLMLMYLDCLVLNVDRHNENMGILRDKKTGKLISLAPNFDNNISLLATSSKLNLDPSKDSFIRLFYRFLKENKEASRIYKTLKLTKVTQKMLNEIFNEIEIKVDEKMVSEFIINRYKYLKNIQDKL